MHHPTAPPEYTQPQQQQQQQFPGYPQQQQQQQQYPGYAQQQGGYTSQGGYPGAPMYPGGPPIAQQTGYNPYVQQQEQPHHHHHHHHHHQPQMYPPVPPTQYEVPPVGQHAAVPAAAPAPVTAMTDLSTNMAGLAATADPVREKAFLEAKAENEILLQMLDDALCEEQHAKGKSEKGIEERVYFTNIDGVYHSLENTNDWMNTCYRQKRSHMAAKKFAMTDIVDTFSEKLHDALHSNTITNSIESNIKQTGYKIMGSFGKKLNRATQKIETAVSGSNSKMTNLVKGTQQRFGTMEVPEVKMFWKEVWPVVAFGQAMKNKYFDSLLELTAAIDSAGIPNTPACVRAAQVQWDACNQTDPVLWRFKTLPIRVRQAEQAIAETLGVDPNDLKFTLNADFSVAAILRSLPWQPGDEIICLTADLSSGVNKAVTSLAKTYGYEIHTVEVPAPGTGESVQQSLKRFCKSLPKGHSVKLAIFSEVGYNTGIKVSVKKMTKYLHAAGISSIVDGTHAIGHRDINIAGKGTDWYIATLSQWMYTPHGTGIIIAHPLKQPVTNTLTVSYFDRGPMGKSSFTNSFEKEFSYTGLQDFSNWCASIQSLQFVEKICGGFGAIRQYTFKLANHVVTEIKRIWGTSPIQLDAVGALPVFPIPNGADQPETLPAMLTLYCALNGYLVRFSTLTVSGHRVVCARFTCQIFNELSEYTNAAHFIASLNYSSIPLPQDIDLSLYETI